MRRLGRPGGGVTHAYRNAAAPIPDSISLIRSFDSDSNPTRPVRPSPLTASTVGDLPLDLLDRLRSFPLFKAAPDAFLAAIGSCLRPQLHNPNDYILTEGDDAKAMYWLVRGAVRVTSRDGESTYAELKPGAFFGEIGILMDIPRTATIIAKLKSLVVRLNKEDLQKVLPQYPDVERAIREEAVERLAILDREKKTRRDSVQTTLKSTKRPREPSDGDKMMTQGDYMPNGAIVGSKRRKSPSPGLVDSVGHASVLRSGSVNVRPLLKELPLFAELPQDILHFIGLNAQPRSYAPFTEIVKQGSPGRDIYFIVSGEVEVVSERPELAQVLSNVTGKTGMHPQAAVVKARLRPGQYFGEVTSLSLAPTRTATVRSVGSVECLMIVGTVLDELWERCSPVVRETIERTARERLQATRDNDVTMGDDENDKMIADDLTRFERARRQSVPAVTLTGITPEASPQLQGSEDTTYIEPNDPDPYLNVDLENVRSRSRRGSLAPAPPPPAPAAASNALPPSPPIDPRTKSILESPRGKSQFAPRPMLPPPRLSTPAVPLVKRPKTPRIDSARKSQIIPDEVLVVILNQLNFLELVRARLVSTRWKELITSSPNVLQYLDLSPFNRFVNDHTIKNNIARMVNGRPKSVDIGNCFHITDEGFSALAEACGENVKRWRMKSVWDVTGQAVLEMAGRAKGLEAIDLSNCRKVGDNLLARIVGWVVPELSQQQQQAQAQMAANNGGRTRSGSRTQQDGQQGQQANQPAPIPPGTVIGCPALKSLTLSYCKHITDRSMAHIAAHAAARIESIDLTRCTTITDAGFQHWSVWKFPMLKKLVLADCTYLTDQAIVGIVGAARGLKVLDLSFCCALSDTSTEILALGLPNLTSLNLAFCGSAVSDASLRAIGLHLLELEDLSVRGCVRVTRQGLRYVVEGCASLKVMDVSQCRNLEGSTWGAGGRASIGGMAQTSTRDCDSPGVTATNGDVVMSGVGNAVATKAASGLDALSDGGRVLFVSVADGRFRGDKM